MRTQGHLCLPTAVLLPLLLLGACSSLKNAIEPPTLHVPRGAPIVADGRLANKEWSDAAVVPLGSGAKLLTKQAREIWLLAVRLPAKTVRYVDVYVVTSGGQMINYHASLRQGVRVFPAGSIDDGVSYRWGTSTLWKASTARREIVEQDPSGPVGIEGYELAISVAQTGVCPKLARVEVRDFFGRQLDWVYPANSTRSNPSSWARVLADCSVHKSQ